MSVAGMGGKKSGKKAGKKGSGARGLHVRVKTARGRTTSSARWLERQLNDPYVAAAKRDGYRSRAAYKLIEIDDKHHFLKTGARVVDLGAAPGGWCQVAAARVKSAEGKGRVIGVDLQEVEPIPGTVQLHLDFMEEGADDKVKDVLDGEADVVLSDMAASSTGHRQTDHLKIIALCEAAAQFAREVLAEGGTFCAKVLRGGTERELLEGLKRDFTTVRHVKPAASRADSAEMYVLATGFRAKGQEEEEG
ncbi:RlmE family RNA methyltransferase [Tepidicaulis sp. LMO-SS28]|uniref:RlmE family RNA methyltransferase n=1 Tax=Tepidicaulis sp. LMO-SS28 TaxID=3447455 RepID=UPI003EDFD51B